MGFNRSRLIVALCISFTFMTMPATAQQLRVGTYEWPPYATGMENNRIGIVFDLYAALAIKTGLIFQLNFLPLKRLLLGFEEKTLDAECLVDASWRESYANSSVYSIPVLETANIILMKKAQAIKAGSVNDFTGMKIGCNLGYFYTDGFQEAFDSRSIRREDTISADSLVLMLHSRRLDGIILDQYEARYTLRKLGLDPSDFTVAYTFLTKSNLSIRLHTDKKELLPRLNEGIREIRADGTVNKILQAYID